MRLHVVGLPHTHTTRRYSWCAYTQKVRHFADMMTANGHRVFLYAGKHNEADCSEHIVCHENEMFGQIPNFEDRNEPLFTAMNKRVIAEMSDRLWDDDMICLILGTTQQSIASAFPNHRTVEYGVGYQGTFSQFRVFESYAWMHAMYGFQQGPMAADGKFFDAVIPNSYDKEDFPAGYGAGGYLLYIGRHIYRKGVEVAELIAERSGHELKIVGPGSEMGVVGPEQRAHLMGEAIATVVPTLYVEPFGGVAVESMLCGTPVITTDWGAFSETVDQGVTGWRCRDMGEFVWAAKHVKELDRDVTRMLAQSIYGTDVVRHQYDHYFKRLEMLPEPGWYTTEERQPL